MFEECALDEMQIKNYTGCQKVATDINWVMLVLAINIFKARTVFFRSFCDFKLGILCQSNEKVRF